MSLIFLLQEIKSKVNVRLKKQHHTPILILLTPRRANIIEYLCVQIPTHTKKNLYFFRLPPCF